MSQMFDVRPVQADGSLDLEKIQKGKGIVNLKSAENPADFFMPVKAKINWQTDYYKIEPRKEKLEHIQENYDLPTQLSDQAEKVSINKIINNTQDIYFQPIIKKKEIVPMKVEEKEEILIEEPINYIMEPINDLPKPETYQIEEIPEEEIFIAHNPEESYFAENFQSSQENITRKLEIPRDFFRSNFFKLNFSLVGAVFLVCLLIFGTIYAKKGFTLKTLLMQDGKVAYANLAQAQESILNKDFSQSSFQFQEAYDNFDSISKEINNFGGILVEVGSYIPFVSKLSSGEHLAQAGKDISKVGILAGEVMEELNGLKNPLKSGDESVSLLKLFQDIDQKTGEISERLASVEENVKKIDVEDIPTAQRAEFIKLKEQLPKISSLASGFSSNSAIIEDVLGGNGPRKYLFLFQNNQEMRATGGFIGTYGVLDIFDGHVKKFFIDGIFNPDGQLKEKVIPPFPVQKISAAWSLHDSNWFPDFPVSAEKATWFYEKTGGPTVDGVITMTPTVMQKLLAVTGPIEMPDYGVTIDENNFLENIQQEVEVDFDKGLNQPKKILADLAPIMLDKIFNARSFSDISKIGKILQESLNEKQILIYSKNYELEKKLSDLGWSGEVINTPKDYLSVINSNINGFKTDGVVDEKIELNSEIQNDGTIVNDVTITRKHNGGNLKYDWWNKVNADYMRVYVPKGAQLISAEGQTREFDTPPLDYKTLGFKHDPQVEQEEEGIKVDEESGTRIYEDAGKTVFANWVYVSPQETVVVKYKYLLPFSIKIDEKGKNIDTYSLVAQKQSGSLGSKFIATLNYPSEYNVTWQYPENAKNENGKITLESDLTTDKYIGVAFSK